VGQVWQGPAVPDRLLDRDRLGLQVGAGRRGFVRNRLAELSLLRDVRQLVCQQRAGGRAVVRAGRGTEMDGVVDGEGRGT
jgi:hypothetical protein